MPYVAGEEAPSITEWAAGAAAGRVRVGIPASVRITAEPGRAIVAAAAITCYTVGTIKQLPGHPDLRQRRRRHERQPAARCSTAAATRPSCPGKPDAARPFIATVVGKHCESGDVIVRDARLPADLAVGDILATPVTGAYGHSMASNYNKVRRPPVVFVRDGEAQVVVRRETFEDLLALDV